MQISHPYHIDQHSVSDSSGFKELQKRFTTYYEDIFLNDMAEKTVVIIPSLTLDSEMLGTIKGALFYEERMLCMLMLLRMPRTHIIYITSVPIENSIVDYYLHLLPGITAYHAKQRLLMMSCYDASTQSLTEKILKRPRLIKRIKEQIKQPHLTHMSCFNVTEFEKKLALDLDIPIYGCDPDLLYMGTKSGSRLLFKELGILLPEGFENLQTKQDIIQSLAVLKKQNPSLRKAVVKMNDGFSGEGNAIYRYKDLYANDENIMDSIQSSLHDNLCMVANNLTYDVFMQKFESMGGIVEAFIEGEIKESPSVQCRINPIGETDIISTHDQLMGGESKQVFIGAAFPANPEYHYDIATIGKKVSDGMQKLGVLARFGLDFISIKEDTGWTHYAIEINLRKGGTTHPFMMIQFLTGGYFDWKKGTYITLNNQERCYFASDNVVNEKYIGLTPHDLIDIAMCNTLLYDVSKQTGVVFHMIGALSQYGKLGMVCIGNTIEEAKGFYDKTVMVLNKECGVLK